MLVSRNHRTRRQLLAGHRLGSIVTAFALIATGTAFAPSASAADKIKISKATFAREVTSDFKAKGEATDFYGNETVYLLLKIKGRPKEGVIGGHWMFRGSEIGKASVDLASINKGVFFSFGQDSFVKFNFTPAKANPLPVGSSYAVVIDVNGVTAGKYPFTVIPPKGALPSKLVKATLSDAKGGALKTTFAMTDTVYLNITADLGLATWLEATWMVSGKEDPNGTRNLSLKENKPAVDGHFSFAPAGGWPKGAHSVVLVMNDKQVGVYKFTVS